MIYGGTAEQAIIILRNSSAGERGNERLPLAFGDQRKIIAPCMPLSSDRKGRKIAEDGGGLTRFQDLSVQSAKQRATLISPSSDSTPTRPSKAMSGRSVTRSEEHESGRL